MLLIYSVWLVSLLLVFESAVTAADPRTPEEVLRALVRANAEKDLSTISKLMAHDADIISYTIGGRKYVGWTEFARDMQEEFDSATRLEIPITELKVWIRGDTAWFAMELDYIRFAGTGKDLSRTILPLRETGVLERRSGEWVLLSWHESSRRTGVGVAVTNQTHSASTPVTAEASSVPHTPNLSGEWEIQEEDKAYKATLDHAGNGAYTHQGGRIATTAFVDRRWQGTWHQTGNDREGGFEVLLSEDGTEATGVWWYTRVGDKANIPPRQWGGTYHWKRLTPVPSSTSLR
ncbi:MAG: nuclear transport factor 2 family protein [Nitrospirae bacterium]|nr:nuclear transport factor 2 family protein [Nitrospirota bacterium]